MKRWIIVLLAALVMAAGLDRTGAKPPEQVKAVKAFHRAGQTFITFADAEDKLSADPTWGQVRDYRADTDSKRKIRYRVYRHDKPITAASLKQATRLGEVEPLSGINVNAWSLERLINQVVFGNEDQGELGRYGPFSGWNIDSPQAGKLILPRFAVQAGKALAPGVGLYVHSAKAKALAYYAVTAVAAGEENTADFGTANSLAKPVAEAAATWQPVEQAAGKPFGFDFRGTRHFYVTWVAPPLAPKPMYFNWSVLVPPNCKSPAPVELSFHGPGFSYARPSVKFFDRSIQICPHDFPFSGWYGYNDALATGGEAEDGKVRPYTIRRIDAFLKWAQGQFPIDPKRIVAVGGDGAALMAIYRPKLFAYVISMGFESRQLNRKAVKDFERAWGPRSEKIADEDGRSEWGWGEPDFVLTGQRLPNVRDKKKPPPDVPKDAPGFKQDLPLFVCGGRSWGVDPGYARGRGRMYYAIQGTLHPLYGRWGWRRADYPEKFSGLWYGLDITNDMPVPAITGASGDVDSEADGNANGWYTWKDAKETAEGFEITFHGPAGKFNLTPRRLSKFKIAPGDKVAWEIVPVQVKTWSRSKKPEPKSGQAVADAHGLVTLTGVELVRGWGVTVRITKAK